MSIVSSDRASHGRRESVVSVVCMQSNSMSSETTVCDHMKSVRKWKITFYKMGISLKFRWLICLIKCVLENTHFLWAVQVIINNLSHLLLKTFQFLVFVAVLCPLWVCVYSSPQTSLLSKMNAFTLHRTCVYGLQIMLLSIAFFTSMFKFNQCFSVCQMCV